MNNKLDAHFLFDFAVGLGIANFCLGIFLMLLAITNHLNLPNVILVIFFNFILFMLVAFQSSLSSNHE